MQQDLLGLTGGSASRFAPTFANTGFKAEPIHAFI
jgi:hypothetical protein